MQVNINVQNNDKLSISNTQYIPAEYLITLQLPHDPQLANALIQILQNILISNNIPFSIGGDAIGS